MESDGAPPFTQQVSNEIYHTALQLTGYDWIMAQLRYYDFVDDIKRTPFFERILPAMRDYYETKHYVFTHGWIPSYREPSGTYRFYPAWRDAGQMEWKNARWINGMDAAQTATIEGKTVICGHCHASYGHSRIEKQCSEFGADADFSPYNGPGIIAIDLTIVHTDNARIKDAIDGFWSIHIILKPVAMNTWKPNEEKGNNTKNWD